MSIQPWSKENGAFSGPVTRPWTGIFSSECGQRSLRYVEAGTRADAVAQFRAIGRDDELVAVVFGHHGDCILDVMGEHVDEVPELDGWDLDPTIYATGTES